MNIINKGIRKIVRPLQSLKNARSRKVFCIGKNKTGTTSMASLFEQLGLSVGSQRVAEQLTVDWLDNKYDRIIKYSKYGGVAFQDIPFSLPNTYKELDKAFPGSKFILTERKSPEIWCDSLINFHSKIFGNGNIPTEQNLREATYVHKGFAWEVMSALHDLDPQDVYNRETLINDYIAYNQGVKQYFKGRKDSLLVATLEDENIVNNIKSFLGIDEQLLLMPWENKTILKNQNH